MNGKSPDLVLERAIAWGQDDQMAARYPNRANFVAADHPDHGQMASTALAEGNPVVLIFPDGHEVLIVPGENGALRVEARDSTGQRLAA